ncbi:MAG: TIGR03067 domain-containing protein [Pirellulales bacterium]
MEKNLPARPNLDHLRRQAKSLLAALQVGEREAVATILEHLPAAKGMASELVATSGFRLADAQSAIARKNGFGSWPHLARHVEQLRALEGTWEFAQLEIDGSQIPVGAVAASRLLIDGDRFRTESPETIYEGVFNIDVEHDPHQIDIDFVSGPEAGNRNFGIFRVEGDALEICLDLNGKPRPTQFGSTPGSGHAYETLRRTSQSRPSDVTGGSAPMSAPASESPACEAFAYVPCPTLEMLQGDWEAVKIVRDGQELPQMMLRTGRRTASKNEVRISFGGQTMIHALVQLDERPQPMHVDYCNLDQAAQGSIQLGLMQWIGDEACFCMAGPGLPRPTDFSCEVGSGRTLSQWRRCKRPT